MVFGLGLGISYTTRLQPVVLQLLSYTRRSGMTLDTTRLQPVVLQLLSYTRRAGMTLAPPGFSRWYFKFTVPLTHKVTTTEPRLVQLWSSNL
jgi:hypothetical protein